MLLSPACQFTRFLEWLIKSPCSLVCHLSVTKKKQWRSYSYPISVAGCSIGWPHQWCSAMSKNSEQCCSFRAARSSAFRKEPTHLHGCDYLALLVTRMHRLPQRTLFAAATEIRLPQSNHSQIAVLPRALKAKASTESPEQQMRRSRHSEIYLILCLTIRRKPIGT